MRAAVEAAAQAVAESRAPSMVSPRLRSGPVSMNAITFRLTDGLLAMSSRCGGARPGLRPALPRTGAHLWPDGPDEVRHDDSSGAADVRYSLSSPLPFTRETPATLFG